MSSPSSVLIKRHDFAQRDRKPFTPGGPVIFDVVRGGYIQRLILSHRDTLVISAGTVNGTSLGENPGNLITQVLVDAAPVGNIKNLLTRSLIRRTFFDFGYPVVGTALTGAAGTFTLDQDYYLPFSIPGSPKAIETALQSDIFSSIQVKVFCGSRDTQFSGNDRTFAFSTNLELTDQREIMQGDSALLFESDLTDSVSGANPARSITGFPVGQRYLDMLFIAETTNQQLADTIINRVTVKSGSAVFSDGFVRDYKADMVRWAAAPVATTPFTGLVYVPLSPDRTLGGAIDARFLSQMAAIVDESNPGTDRLIIAQRRALLPADMGK